jgi:hypothetical protein
MEDERDHLQQPSSHPAPEFPPLAHTVGQPDPPRAPYGDDRRSQPPPDLEGFGAESAAAELAERIAALHAGAARLGPDGHVALEPPFAAERDHFEGNPHGRVTLVVFGAFGTPGTRVLHRLITGVRERHADSVIVAWRHYPDPVAHPHATVLALAAEAAATRGHFWAVARQLLAMRHDDPSDLHAALVRANVDPGRAREQMQAGAGADRIVGDVESALRSGVAYSPALFIDDERYTGELEPAAVLDELDRRLAASGGT